MLFPTPIFVFIFGPIAILGYWLIRNQRLRYYWLILASYIFYGWWDPRFCGLLIISTLVDYFVGIRLNETEDPVVRKRWIVVSLVTNLGMLGFFKYAMFLMSSWNTLIGWVGVGPTLPNYNIVLPIGISFFTFQTMSYTIDVYRRKIKPTYDLAEFATYVALFPQLIAGPIVRYAEIMHTLKNLPVKLSRDYLTLGLFYFAVGLSKKVLIADRIDYFVAPMFTNYQNLTSGEAWIAVMGWTIQIYYDFAGYSLMAVGLGHLLGFEFPQNFNSPFKAISVSDLWKRWHLTLSSWLKDYLYVPLGGRNRRALALSLTMLLGGLWHGPDWTFVLWGGFHAIGLELHHRLKNVPWFPRNLVYAQIATFIYFSFSLAIFRPRNIGESYIVISKMLNLKDLVLEKVAVAPVLLLLMAAGLLWGMLGPNMIELVRIRKVKPKPIWGIVVGILVAICILYLSESGPFLYWQF